MNRIALAAAPVLQVGDGEVRVVRDGRLDHRQSLAEGNVRGDGFVGGRCGGDKQNAIQGADFAHLLGNTQVRQMDRVECAAENADFHTRFGRGRPQCLPGCRAPTRGRP